MSESGEPVLPVDAATLVAAIVEHDKITPGYGLTVLRALVVRLPVSDVATVIRQPPKPKSSSISPDALIG